MLMSYAIIKATERVLRSLSHSDLLSCAQWAFGWAPRFGLWEWEVTEPSQVCCLPKCPSILSRDCCYGSCTCQHTSPLPDAHLSSHSLIAEAHGEKEHPDSDQAPLQGVACQSGIHVE